MDVGVRELKAKLSMYLQRAAAGEHITVTDRGRPLAVLGPILGRVDLDAAAEAGWLSRPSADGLPHFDRLRADRTTRDVLDEDRGR